MQAAAALGIAKRELEADYYYDELITLLDMQAYAHADEKERARYAAWPVRWKITHGEAVRREEVGEVSMFR